MRQILAGAEEIKVEVATAEVATAEVVVEDAALDVADEALH
jgi:hypothetical protein